MFKVFPKRNNWKQEITSVFICLIEKKTVTESKKLILIQGKMSKIWNMKTNKLCIVSAKILWNKNCINQSWNKSHFEYYQ